MRWPLALTAVLVAVTACSGPTPPPAPATPAAPATSAATVPSSAPGVPSGSLPPLPPPPSQEVSYAPGASAPPASTGSVPEPSRRAATEPAPTAAGPLDEKALPNPVGPFAGRAGAPTEGEYNPNGAWVHAVEAPVASHQAMPACGDPGRVPSATHALAGTYADPAGVPGNGLALEFGSDREAADWYATFVTQLGRCTTPESPFQVSDLRKEQTSFTARRATRFDGAQWTEAGRVKGRRVVMVVVGGSDHDPAMVAEAVGRV